MLAKDNKIKDTLAHSSEVSEYILTWIIYFEIGFKKTSNLNY